MVVIPQGPRRLYTDCVLDVAIVFIAYNLLIVPYALLVFCVGLPDGGYLALPSFECWVMTEGMCGNAATCRFDDWRHL